MHARIAVTTIAFALAAGGADPLDELLGRIDKAAAGFRGVSATVKRVAHNGVINEDDLNEGTILVKRAKANDLRMLSEITHPDPKIVAFQGKKLEIFLPKMQTVQEIDVGKSRTLVEQFFLLGFGTPRRDIERDYVVKMVGAETVAGQKTLRLELTPKSAQVGQQLKKAELWIAENGYPVQQKFHQSGGDYNLVTYTDMKVNPEIPDAALKLKLPKNVKREFPGRN